MAMVMSTRLIMVMRGMVKTIVMSTRSLGVMAIVRSTRSLP